MSGATTTCKDNPRVGRQGCGVGYGGGRVHCQEPAAWSTHPDGRCHHTFSTYSVMDTHMNPLTGVHVDPATVRRYHADDGHLVFELRQDDRGVWHGYQPDNPNTFADR